MKNKLFLLAVGFILLLATSAHSQPLPGAGEGKGTLKVVVDGCPSDRGVARIALVNSAEGYNNSAKAFMSVKVPVSKGKAVHDFKDVPFGEYAVTAYHDENDNNRLDKGVFGKPTEAYGFSNNARGLLGRPDYKKTAFVFNKPGMIVMVHVE
jgi:uncharacterized protein (DUF2141 family)